MSKSLMFFKSRMRLFFRARAVSHQLGSGVDDRCSALFSRVFSFFSRVMRSTSHPGNTIVKTGHKITLWERAIIEKPIRVLSRGST